MDASCGTSFANGNSNHQQDTTCIEVSWSTWKYLEVSWNDIPKKWWKSWRTKSEVTGQVGDLPEARFVVSPMVLLHIHQNIVENPPLKTSIRHSWFFFDNITPYRSEYSYYSWKTTEDLKIFEDPPICWISFEEHHATVLPLMSQERGFIGFIDWCPRRIEENYFRRQLPDFFDDFSMILKDSPLFFIVVH